MIIETSGHMTQEQISKRCKVNDTPQLALHIEWNDLSDIFAELLTGLLGRGIEAKSSREEYYYWEIHLHDTPLSQTEIEALFSIAGADELDRDQNDYGDYPIMELCQGLCIKLMRRLLPFIPAVTLADDAGVWFISSCADSANKPTVEKALPEGMALVAESWDEPEYPGIRISLREPGRHDELIYLAEHNSAKPASKELCIAVYSRDHDEPVYYESYGDPQNPSPNN